MNRSTATADPAIPPGAHDFAIELAHAAAAITRPRFSDPALRIELKSDHTLVTDADRNAEQAMRQLITRRFPTHGIVGEEFGQLNPNAEYVWGLDPIDGTISFVAGVPLFVTLIALKHNDQPVLGVIHQPVSDELLIGHATQTTLNGRPVRVRPITSIEDSVLLVTDLKNVEIYQQLGPFLALTRRSKTPRGWGDGYGYLLLATGRADIVCDPIVNPWDIAALIPVVRGAGGVITDWQGRDPVNAKSIIASATPALHADVIRTLNP